MLLETGYSEEAGTMAVILNLNFFSYLKQKSGTQATQIEL